MYRRYFQTASDIIDRFVYYRDTHGFSEKDAKLHVSLEYQQYMLNLKQEIEPGPITFKDTNTKTKQP